MGGASSSEIVDVRIAETVAPNAISPLMCVGIASVLPHPIQQAYIRSAGQVGVRIYKELIVLRKIPCCLEHPCSTEPPPPLSSAGVDDEQKPPTSRRRGLLPSSSRKWKVQSSQLIPIHISTKKPIQGLGSLFQTVVTTKKSLQRDSTLVVFPDVARRLGTQLFKKIFPSTIPAIKCVRYCYDANAENPPEFIRIPNTELVELEGFDSVSSIGHQFHGFTMKSIDISALLLTKHLTAISDRFLYQCKNITQIDLSPFVNVTTIGKNFMETCESLQAIDLRPLSKVSTIGENFLAYTTNLRSVKFGSSDHEIGSAGPNVVVVGHQTVDDKETMEAGMGGNITAIGRGFLFQATSLEKIDFKNFTKVKTIGEFFLSFCLSLRYVDLRPFGDSVESVGICLAYGCNEIVLDHHPNLPNVSIASILKNSKGRCVVRDGTQVQPAQQPDCSTST